MITRIEPDGDTQRGKPLSSRGIFAVLRALRQISGANNRIRPFAHNRFCYRRQCSAVFDTEMHIADME